MHPATTRPLTITTFPCAENHDKAPLCSAFACLLGEILKATALEECCPFFGLWHIVAIAHASRAKENTL